MIQHLAHATRLRIANTRLLDSRREDGQGLVEYSLVIALIALAVAGAVGALGTALVGLYGTFPGAF